MKKGLPFIPVQLSDMGAEFAEKQYIINNTRNKDCNQSKMYNIFKDSIIRLLYANFKWSGDITPVESNMIEKQLITTGRIVAVKSTLDVDKKQPEGVFYGYLGIGDNVINTLQVNKPKEFIETFNFYGQPESVSCTGLNGTMITVYNSDSYVIGYDTTAVNVLSPIITPLYTYIDNLANLLDKAYKSWRIAIETNKLGMVFNAQDKVSMQLIQKVLKGLTEDNPYVIIQGNMAATVETLFRGGSLQGLGVFYQNFLNAWSMLLDLLGIENESAQKRERMVVEEAIRNNSLSKCIGYDRLRARQNFAEEINRKFNKNIIVTNAFTQLLNKEDLNGDGQIDNTNVMEEKQ